MTEIHCRYGVNCKKTNCKFIHREDLESFSKEMIRSRFEKFEIFNDTIQQVARCSNPVSCPGYRIGICKLIHNNPCIEEQQNGTCNIPDCIHYHYNIKPNQKNKITKPCRDGSNCKVAACKFYHSETNSVIVSDNNNNNNKTFGRCRYGKGCRNKSTCKFDHSNNKKKINESCRDGPGCDIKDCKFDHQVIPNAVVNSESANENNNIIIINKKTSE